MVVLADDSDIVFLVANHQRRCRYFDIAGGGNQQRDINVTPRKEFSLGVVEVHFNQQGTGARIQPAAGAADATLVAPLGIGGIHDLDFHARPDKRGVDLLNVRGNPQPRGIGNGYHRL